MSLADWMKLSKDEQEYFKVGRLTNTSKRSTVNVSNEPEVEDYAVVVQLIMLELDLGAKYTRSKSKNDRDKEIILV